MNEAEITLLEDIDDKEVKRISIFAEKGSITQSEYEAAGQKDLRPQYKFTVYAFEYNDETKLEYNGCEYYIYRTYQKEDSDKIELYTAERLGKR